MDAEIQIFVLLTLCSVLFLPMPGNCKIVNSFTATLHDGKLQHLVVDSVSGKVYVGAINRLYQLTETLQLEVAVITGPHNDNPFCPPPVSECHCVGSNCKDFEKSPIDSFNKALLIDSRSERLISCSNLFQGHCTKHLLGNISLTDPPVWSMIVPNDETSSIAIFVAPGPPNPASTNVLYVASTRSSNGFAGISRHSTGHMHEKSPWPGFSIWWHSDSIEDGHRGPAEGSVSSSLCLWFQFDGFQLLPDCATSVGNNRFGKVCNADCKNLPE